MCAWHVSALSRWATLHFACRAHGWVGSIRCLQQAGLLFLPKLNNSSSLIPRHNMILSWEGESGSWFLSSTHEKISFYIDSLASLMVDLKWCVTDARWTCVRLIIVNLAPAVMTQSKTFSIKHDVYLPRYHNSLVTHEKSQSRELVCPKFWRLDIHIEVWWRDGRPGHLENYDT